MAKKKINRYKNGGEQLPKYQNGKNEYYDYPSNTTNNNPWGNNQLAFNDPRVLPQAPAPNYSNLRLPSLYENTVNSAWKKPATSAPQVQQASLSAPRPVASATQAPVVAQTTVPQTATSATVTTASQPAGQFSHSSQQVPQSIGYTPTVTTYQAPASAFDESNFTAGQDWAQGNPLPQMGGFQGFNYNPNAVDVNNMPSSILNGSIDDSTASQTNSAYEKTPDFANYYGGVDITSRLAYGANQLGKGNGAGAAIGLGSAGLGLARVGFGAYAAGKRGEYVKDEYNTNMNKYQVPATQHQQDGGMIDFMQMGGQKSLTDVGVQNLNANKSFAGLEVTPEFGKSGYFVTEEQLRQQEAAKLAQEQMLKNQQMNHVVDITSDGQFTNRKVWHTQRPEWFVGKQTPIEGKDFSTVPYKQWNSYQQSPAYTNYLNQNKPQNVAQFQDGGQQPQGQGVEQQIADALQGGAPPEQIIQQLVQNGVPEDQAAQMVQGIIQQLQGSQEQQPMMEDGGQIVKKLTGEYTTDDSGNPLVNAEIEKNEFVQNPDGSVTKAIGASHEQGGIKTELEPGTRIVSDHLKVGAELANHFKDTFGIEVKAKDTYAKVLDTFTRKSGLQKIVDEQEEIIEQLKKQEEIKQDSPASQSTVAFNKKFLGSKLKELEDEKAPIEEQRKALLDVVYNFQEASKSEEVSEEPMYADGGEHPDPARWQDYLTQIRALGYKGSENVGDMQNWVAQNYPDNVVNYFTQSGQPMTAKHVDIVKNKFKDAFTKTGISPSKPSASYTVEEKTQLQNALGENATKNFWLEGFKDNKKDWRFPLLSMNAGVKAAPMPQQTPITAPPLPNFYQAPEAVMPAVKQEAENAVAQVKDNTQGQNMMLLPDQSGMFPNSLQGASKITRRYDRVEAPQLTPDAQIQAINAQSQMAMNQLAGAPSNQTASQISNLNNLTQQNVSKAIADTNRANIASDADAQYKNAQIQMAEENARAQDVQSYENKILRAQAVTDADVNNYYNHEQQTQLANYNAIQNLNLVNQMNDNFAYTSNGIQRVGADPKFSLNPQQMLDYSKYTTKKKTTKARFGGKIK